MLSRLAIRLPLWFVLFVPFAAILVAGAGLIGYLGIQNGAHVAADLTYQLLSESTARVSQNLDAYFAIPQSINEQNRIALRLNQLQVDDSLALQRQFLAQISGYPSIKAIAYGSETGTFIAAFRNFLGADFVFAEASAESGYVLRGYAANAEGERGELLREIPNYDPRPRQWYQSAVQAGHPTWTPIYTWVDQLGIAVDVVSPVYSSSGDLLGVLDVSLDPAGIGDFLRGVSESQSENAFIVDEARMLVATSTLAQPYEGQQGAIRRFSMLDVPDPLVQQAAARIDEQFGTWDAIESSHPFMFDLAGENQLAQVTPYETAGSRWWIVVVTPESAYLTPINAQIDHTLQLIIISLLISVILMSLGARWITRPILALNQTAAAFAGGDWSKRLVLNRRDVVGQLADTFNDMADQLHTFTASLQSSEARLRAIFENSADAIIVAAKGMIVTANPALIAMFGYARLEEVTGKPVLHLVVPAERARIADYVERRARGEPAPMLYETRGQRQDGSEFVMEVRISTYRQNGELYSIAILRDITEHVLNLEILEERVRTRTAQLQAAEVALRQALVKEKELGELKTRFLSMASHEFRTPLATILSLTETLSAYWERLSRDKIEQRFVKIRQQIGYLSDIMEDVLLLASMQSRRHQFNPALLNLDMLCQSILDDFHSRPDFSHQLDYTCSGAPREVKLDQKLMRQTLTNLVSNAIKYSPPGSVIHVELQFQESRIVLKVRDHGIGIPEADLPHLFEPFHRAANVGTISGTGLGLVITKESVELHGGGITVESQPNLGTTFVIVLPKTIPNP